MGKTAEALKRREESKLYFKTRLLRYANAEFVNSFYLVKVKICFLDTNLMSEFCVIVVMVV